MNISNKICAVMQPTYAPWMGYFDLIDQVDKFIFLDDVQLEKNSWQLRNRIKTAQGELYLSISRKRDKRSKTLPLIKDTEINDLSEWRMKHVKTIEIAYKKALFFKDIFPFIESLINSDLTNLSQFNINIIKSICHEIGIKTDFFISSQIENIIGEKDQRVASLCKAIGCCAYLSPVGASSYIERKNPGGEFINNNINLYYHNYKHPTYDQLYAPFMPYMSIIDLLFNVGFNNSLKIIRKGRHRFFDYDDINKQ